MSSPNNEKAIGKTTLKVGKKSKTKEAFYRDDDEISQNSGTENTEIAIMERWIFENTITIMKGKKRAKNRDGQEYIQICRFKKNSKPFKN